MSLRTWIYQSLLNDAQLAAFHGGRVYQGGALTTSTVAKPFLIYHIGNDVDEGLAEVDATAHRRYFQVYVHDKPGEYSRIDDIGDRVKQLLNGASSPANHVIMVNFLERSQDLDDKVMDTIFNYVRFRAIFGQ